jgi:hypothetical protein
MRGEGNSDGESSQNNNSQIYPTGSFAHNNDEDGAHHDEALWRRGNTHDTLKNHFNTITIASNAQQRSKERSKSNSINKSK